MAVIVVGILSFGAGVVAAYISTVAYLFIAAVTLTVATIGIGIVREASLSMMLLAWAISAAVMQLGFAVAIGVQAFRRERVRQSQVDTNCQDQQVPVRSPDTFEL